MRYFKQVLGASKPVGTYMRGTRYKPGSSGFDYYQWGHWDFLFTKYLDKVWPLGRLASKRSEYQDYLLG
jgi:hypothetical protein